MVELEAYQKTDAYRNFLKKQTERKRKSMLSIIVIINELLALSFLVLLRT